MSTDQIKQSYEAIPYPDLCYTQTHPDRLATLATLLGLKPAPVTRCRVLELGCAIGGNLIPMAYGLPDSEFVGIDLSPRQIDMGQTAVRDLALSNISLHAADIMDIGPEWGAFDYIIAHGVYSWAPPEVNDKLLAICRRHLAPHGVAYISYNVYPGWHMMGALRDMMLYRIKDIREPQARAATAREFLDFLAEAIEPDDPYGTLGETYQKLLHSYTEFVTHERQQDKDGDQLLLHDELAAVNTAVYFHEFIAHAAQHGLQYLSEAEFARVMPTNLSPHVMKQINQMAGSVIEVEQYMDFVRNRTFRQTLLCHADTPVRRAIGGDLSAFYVASYAQPLEEGMAVRDTAVAQFQSPDGAVLTSDHPVTKAAMLRLAEIAPVALPFTDLLETAREQVYGAAAAQTPIDQDARLLAMNILQAYSYSSRLVELHVHRPPFVRHVGQRPVASSLARRQLSQGQTKVTNLRHERVKLDPISQALLPYLDGTHDRTALLRQLAAHVTAGDLTLADAEGVEEAELPEKLSREMFFSLQWLAWAALLVG